MDPPFLLLHGIPGTRRTWRAVAERLQRRHRVLAPDLLGFGDSDDPPGDFHAPGQASAVLDMLEACGVRAAHVAGFDFGGPIALALYAAAPERVLSLTLAATNAFTDTRLPGPLALARVPLLGDAMFAMMCSLPGLASLWWPAVGDKRALPWLEFRDGLPSRRGRRWTRRVFAESLRHLKARYAAAEATLRTVTCPAAVVWGDRDPFFSLDVGERTASEIPGAALHVLRGCGHFVPQERPQALADVLINLAVSPLRSHLRPA